MIPITPAKGFCRAHAKSLNETTKKRNCNITTPTENYKTEDANCNVSPKRWRHAHLWSALLACRHLWVSAFPYGSTQAAHRCQAALVSCSRKTRIRQMLTKNFKPKMVNFTGHDIHRVSGLTLPVADGRIKIPGGYQELRTSTLIRERPIRGESPVVFLGESEGSLSPPHDSFLDAGEAINDFRSMSGSFIYRHHVVPRVKLYSPREESFPIPLKYIDVSRTTHTNLDVMQERRIDDYWNIDGSRDFSDSWTGSTQFILQEEKPPDGYLWSGGRLTRKQLTSRPDHLWPELLTKLGRNTQLKERQKWSHEGPKLDNARKLRGIYFIDPEDKEFKETIKNARKKLETPMAPAMPCKTSKKSKHGVTRGKSNEIKSKLACILEASESTRLRMGESLPNHHEDHIAGKGDNSLQRENLVHKFIPMPQAMKIPAAKAAVLEEWENWKRFRRGT